MKISIIADVLGSENNGTTITVRRLINNLKKRGHDVKVVSPSKIDEEGYYSVDTIDFKIFNNYVAENGVELAKADKEILKKASSAAATATFSTISRPGVLNNRTPR